MAEGVREARKKRRGGAESDFLPYFRGFFNFVLANCPKRWYIMCIKRGNRSSAGK